MVIVLSVAVTATVLELATTLTGAGERDIRAARTTEFAVVRGLVIAEDDGAPGETSVLRAGLDRPVLDRIQGIDGVDAAAGDVERFAQLIVDGRLVSVEGATGYVGRAWVPDEQLAQFRLTEGRPPNGGGEIVMDLATATAAGATVGDRVGVLYGTGIFEADVVGVATFGDSPRHPMTSTLLFDPTVIEEALGQYDEVLVRSDTLPPDVMVERLGSALGADVEVLTGSALTDEAVATLNGSQLLVRGILVGAGILGTVIGGLVVASTVTITISQRRSDLAVLRLVGADHRQVLAALMAEVALVASVSTAVGLALASIASGPSASLLRWFGIMTPDDPGMPSPGVLLLAGGVGIAAAAIASVQPARAAAATPPIESLRGSQVDPAPLGRRRVALTALGAATGAALLAVGSDAAGFVGLALLAPCAVVLAPTIVRIITAVLEDPIARVGTTGRIGLRQARREPRRVARSATGLWLGAALLTATAVLSASLTAALTDTARSAVRADVIASSADDDVPTISADTLARTIADARVLSASAIRIVEAAATLPGATALEGIDVGAVDPASILTEYDLGILAGGLEALGMQGVAVHQSLGVQVGDVVSIRFPSGTSREFGVVAVFRQRFAGFGAPDLLVSLDALAAAEGPGLFSEVFVSVSDAVGLPEAQEVVAELLGPSVGIVRKATEYGDPEGQIGPARTLIDGLAWVALLIAVIGLLSAIVLSVGARRREISTLRAIGAGRTQIWWMVTVETLVAGLLAAVLSVALGLGLSVVLVDLLASDDPVPWVLPGMRVAAITGAMVVLAVVVAGLPARNITRTSPLEGMSRP